MFYAQGAWYKEPAEVIEDRLITAISTLNSSDLCMAIQFLTMNDVERILEKSIRISKERERGKKKC